MSIKSQDTLVSNGPFAIVNDEDLGGGVRIIDWAHSPSNLSTHLDTQVPEGKRKLGQVVRVRDTVDGVIFEKELSGTVSSPVWIDNRALTDIQSSIRLGLGIESGCLLTLNAQSVDIGAGSFNDPYGRRVTFAGTQSVDFTAAADGTYVVDWDGNSKSFERVLLSTGLVWRQELAFAVVIRSGGVNTILHDARIHVGGVNGSTGFTVGSVSGAQGANFATIRQALLFKNCYGTAQFIPRTFHVLDLAVDTTPISFSSAEFSQASNRLDGLVISGKLVAGTGSPRPTITWDDDTAPWIDAANQVSNLRFEDLSIEYNGVSGTVNTVWLKDPGPGLSVRNCSIGTGSLLTHVVNFSTGSLGGNSDPPTIFDGCSLAEAVTTTGSHFRISTSTAGELVFRNCNFSEPHVSVIKYDSVASPAVRIKFVGGKIADFTSAIVSGAITSQLGSVNISGAEIASGGGALGISDYIDIDNCQFNTSCSLVGAKLVSGCRTIGTSPVITLTETNNIQGCDFLSGSVTGNIGTISKSKLSLGTTGVLNTVDEIDGNQKFFSISDSIIVKNNGNAQSNTMISSSADQAILRLENVKFEYGSASTNSSAMISFTGAQPRLYMGDCYANISNRSSMTSLISFNVDGNTEPDGPALRIDGGRYQCSGEFLSASVNTVTSGDVQISGAKIDCGTPFSINGGAGVSISSVAISNNAFVTTATAPYLLVYGAKILKIEGNSFQRRSGTGTLTFDIGNTSSDGRQEVCQIQDNSWYSNAGWSTLSFDVEDYKNTQICNNSISLENTTSPSVTVSITGDSYTLLSEVSDNDINADGTSSSGVTVSIASSAESAICDNQIYASASAGAANVSISVPSGTEIEMQDNTIRSAGTSGTTSITLGSAGTYLTIDGNNIIGSHALTITPSGYLAMNGNTFRGGTTLTVTGLADGGCSIVGNTFHSFSNDLTIDIDVASGKGIVSSNSLRSGDDCRVYVWGASSCSGIFNSNTIDSSGIATVDIGAAATAGGGGSSFVSSSACNNVIECSGALGLTVRTPFLSVLSGNSLKSTGGAVVAASEGGSSAASLRHSATGNVARGASTPSLQVNGTGLLSAQQCASGNTNFSISGNFGNFAANS